MDMWERDGVLVGYKDATIVYRWTTTDAEGRPLWAFATLDDCREPTRGYPTMEGAWESFLYHEAAKGLS